jgi:hypothetical protein
VWQKRYQLKHVVKEKVSTSLNLIGAGNLASAMMYMPITTHTEEKMKKGKQAEK